MCRRSLTSSSRSAASSSSKLRRRRIRGTMPLVEIVLRAGKSAEYVSSVADAIHQALVSQANVPVDDRFQIVHQVPDTALIANPSYGGVSRSADLIIIRITLNAGRTLEIKKNLYAD